MAKLVLTTEETEKLIDLVRENPGLYDQGLPEYKDAIYQRNCWVKLATQLGYDASYGKQKVV